MATTPSISQFSSTYSNWDGLDFAKVFREDLGTASFISFKPFILSIKKKIDDVNLVKEELSDGILNQCSSFLSTVINQLNVLINYDNAQFLANKTNVETNINAQYQQFLNIWPQIAGLIALKPQTINIDELVKQVKEATEKSTNDAQQIEELKARLSTDLNAFENRYNEQFKRAEFINQEEIFSKQAKEYQSVAKWWLSGIVIFSAIFILVLYMVFKQFCFELACFCNIGQFNYDLICKDCNRTILYLEIFKAVTYRLLIISFILYIINYCVRNYGANMHNYTVNMHKANSLSAALVLIDRAKTDIGNDNIMGQAANAIFSHQPTGYNRKDPENVSNDLIEKLIKNMSPLGKKE